MNAATNANRSAEGLRSVQAPSAISNQPTAGRNGIAPAKALASTGLDPVYLVDGPLLLTDAPITKALATVVTESGADVIILPGTTRSRALELARDEAIPFESGRVSLDELKAADEVMLVGTTIEVLPVIRIDDQPVADGRPGPITQRLQAAFRRSVETWLANG